MPPIAKQRFSERLRQKEKKGESSASTTATAAGPPALVRMNSAQMRTAKAKKMGGGPNSLKTLQKRSAKKPAKSSTPKINHTLSSGKFSEPPMDPDDEDMRAIRVIA